VNHHLPLVRTLTVFPEVDGLPGAEVKSPLADRDVLAGAGQHRTSVRRHVVGALQIMGPAAPLGHQFGEERLEIGAHRRIGVLLNGEAGGGVLDKEGTQACLDPTVLNELRDTGRDVYEVTARGGDLEGGLLDVHEDSSRSERRGRARRGSAWWVGLSMIP